MSDETEARRSAAEIMLGVAAMEVLAGARDIDPRWRSAEIRDRFAAAVENVPYVSEFPDLLEERREKILTAIAYLDDHLVEEAWDIPPTPPTTPSTNTVEAKEATILAVRAVDAVLDVYGSPNIRGENVPWERDLIEEVRDEILDRDPSLGDEYEEIVDYWAEAAPEIVLRRLGGDIDRGLARLLSEGVE